MDYYIVTFYRHFLLMVTINCFSEKYFMFRINISLSEVRYMNIREIRTKLGDTQSEFATRYHIPFRTVQNWETGQR